MIKYGSKPYLECSSKGDKRFSAFYARIGSRGNKSIEELYQAAKVFEDGSTGLSCDQAKGKKATNMEYCKFLYGKLWDIYILENPELLNVLWECSGISDMFGKEGCQCQATELWRIKQWTMLDFQENLAKYYKYNSLKKEHSVKVRKFYYDNLLMKFKLDGNPEWFLHTETGLTIATSYERIVVGDYGAFIEIKPEHMITENIKVQEGQEYRYEEKYKTCKYYWLTAKDDSDVKIYHQKSGVKYADYKAGMYYVSPYEVTV